MNNSFFKWLNYCDRISIISVSPLLCCFPNDIFYSEKNTHGLSNLAPVCIPQIEAESMASTKTQLAHHYLKPSLLIFLYVSVMQLYGSFSLYQSLSCLIFFLIFQEKILFPNIYAKYLYPRNSSELLWLLISL